MRTLSRTLVPAIILFCLPLTAHAEKTINLNFDSTADFTESDGVKGTATTSGLTAAQQAAIIAKVQKEYDDAVGPGKIVIGNGAGGDINIIVSGGQAPDGNKGNEYGDAGQPKAPGVVHVGEFTTDGFAGDNLVNGIAESAAHEAGHKLGLDHNWDDPPTKMTEGSKVTTDQRKADSRSFTLHDAAILAPAIALSSAEQKNSFTTGDLGIVVGKRVGSPPNKPDDNYLDASTAFTGSGDFGYLSTTHEFVLQDTDFLTFIYSAGADLAVELGGSVFDLESGFGSFVLSNPNPFNPSVFRTADITFSTPFGTDELLLNATITPSTGGFVGRISEPSTALLLVIGLISLLAKSRGPRRVRGAGPSSRHRTRSLQAA